MTTPPPPDVHPAWLPPEVFRPLGSRRVLLRGAGLLVDTVHQELAAACDRYGGSLHHPTTGVDRDAADRQPYDLVLALATEDALPAAAAAVRARLTDEPGATDLGAEGYALARHEGTTVLLADAPAGLLYGLFHLVRLGEAAFGADHAPRRHRPAMRRRMLNHWDNVDVHPVMGQVERGYSGGSIFWRAGRLTDDLSRVRAYGRLLAACGVNAVTVNNVNVHATEARLLTDRLGDVATIADTLRPYGIRVHLSVSFAAPVTVGGLATADPADERVRAWWAATTRRVYDAIPDFGGYVVKADSEGQPGPFAYGRSHADGANLLADAVAPFDGVVHWRAFVYNHRQDWRDRVHRPGPGGLRPLRPARRPVPRQRHPAGEVRSHGLPGAGTGLPGARRDAGHPARRRAAGDPGVHRPAAARLLPRATLERGARLRPVGRRRPDRRRRGRRDGRRPGGPGGGLVGVSNVGDDPFWTGHPLAQANLYAFGRLAWDPRLDPVAVLDEWISLTFVPSVTADPERVRRTLHAIMDDSWRTYERYTAPLGVGFMVRPGHHYGPDVDGYEYTPWGTYHFADRDGVGVDRTRATGTGFTGQYPQPWSQVYESRQTCPDELLLFFHHVPYDHVLHSGVTVIQHIYDTHFAGAEQAAEMRRRWEEIADLVDPAVAARVRERLDEQVRSAEEWRDQINTYFYRKSGVPDAHGRRIY